MTKRRKSGKRCLLQWTFMLFWNLPKKSNTSPFCCLKLRRNPNDWWAQRRNEKWKRLNEPVKTDNVRCVKRPRNRRIKRTPKHLEVIPHHLLRIRIVTQRCQINLRQQRQRQRQWQQQHQNRRQPKVQRCREHQANCQKKPIMQHKTQLQTQRQRNLYQQRAVPRRLIPRKCLPWIPQRLHRRPQQVYLKKWTLKLLATKGRRHQQSKKLVNFLLVTSNNIQIPIKVRKGVNLVTKVSESFSSNREESKKRPFIYIYIYDDLFILTNKNSILQDDMMITMTRKRRKTLIWIVSSMMVMMNRIILHI